MEYKHQIENGQAILFAILRERFTTTREENNNIVNSIKEDLICTIGYNSDYLLSVQIIKSMVNIMLIEQNQARSKLIDLKGQLRDINRKKIEDLIRVNQEVKETR